MSNTIPGLSSGSYGDVGKMLSGSGSWSQGDTIGAMQAGSSVLSGLGTMYSDQSKSRSYATQGNAAAIQSINYGIQAGEWKTQAGDETVMGQNTVTGLKSQYLNAIGGMGARLGASGVDVGQGVGAAQRQTIAQNAVSASQTTMLASDIRARRDTINVLQAQDAQTQALADVAASHAAATEGESAGKLALIGSVAGAGLKLLTSGVI